MTDFSYKGFGGNFLRTNKRYPRSLKAGEAVNLKAMFLGNTAGTIGETSAILLILGGIYLIAKKIISWRIPCMLYCNTWYLCSSFWRTWIRYDISLAEQLCGGGLMLGAFFMATDYVTSPITPKGQLIFGILLGILTGIFRLFGWFCRGRILCDHLL